VRQADRAGLDSVWVTEACGQDAMPFGDRPAIVDQLAASVPA
jgi:alkanesulfonate monooxygenase SsuD/methylene tetrahydromethanopterin reductase-like flavin-dependent oxidoreductase (luciferase family)